MYQIALSSRGPSQVADAKARGGRGNKHFPLHFRVRFIYRENFSASLRQCALAPDMLAHLGLRKYSCRKHSFLTDLCPEEFGKKIIYENNENVLGQNFAKWCF